MLIYSVCAKILYLHQLHPVRGAKTKVSTICLTSLFQSFQSNAPRAGCDRRVHCSRSFLRPFQSNAPRAGCDSKTIQFKRILVARRMYSFANYVLHTLKHLPTYCIGTTLQPLNFGAKLPAILCSLEVLTTLMTLLEHIQYYSASALRQ